jgi:hypothetical protein
MRFFGQIQNFQGISPSAINAAVDCSEFPVRGFEWSKSGPVRGSELQDFSLLKGIGTANQFRDKAELRWGPDFSRNPSLGSSGGNPCLWSQALWLWEHSLQRNDRVWFCQAPSTLCLPIQLFFLTGVDPRSPLTQRANGFEPVAPHHQDN